MLFTIVFIGLLSQTLGSILPYESRIVGGEDARAGEIPYIVSLQKNSQHVCGGSILNSRWILTAAHCVYDIDESMIWLLRIQYSITNWATEEKNYIYAKKVKVHPSYQHIKAPIDDVALIELEEAIPLGPLARAITFPTSAVGSVATPALLAGWGYSQTNGPAMQQLQKLKVDIFEHKRCNLYYPGSYKETYELCAGQAAGGPINGQCRGDSGGPLVTIENGAYIQHGIVSWSAKTCGFRPGVLAKVFYYKDWILSNMN